MIKAGIWTHRKAEEQTLLSTGAIQQIVDEAGECSSEALDAQLKKGRAFKISSLMERILSSITDEDIKKLNAYQRIISYSVLYDKHRIEMGLPSAEISIRGLVPTVQKKLDEAQALQQQLVEMLQNEAGVYTVVGEKET